MTPPPLPTRSLAGLLGVLLTLGPSCGADDPSPAPKADAPPEADATDDPPLDDSSATQPDCPTAEIAVEEGSVVTPLTRLHLAGEASAWTGGSIVAWRWSVEQPVGSHAQFVPSETFPNPSLEALVAGVYTLSLEVWHEDGKKSCEPAEVEVVVTPEHDLHVELLWHTPGDADETDGGPDAGADLDLHFAHDLYARSGPDLDGDEQPDPWFDQPFDCFWFNAHPNWSSFDSLVDDDPGLDRDDTDGAGPEVLNMNILENVTYRVGVHYWSDHDYGPSLATLRVYAHGVLVFEDAGVELSLHDMWDAATITWPSAAVHPVVVDGGRKITPGYQNPYFFQP